MGLQSRGPGPWRSAAARYLLESVRDPRFRIFGNAGIDDLSFRESKILGTYGGSSFKHDFMICGTGSNNSIFGQRELQPILPFIQTWKDVYTPAHGRTHPELEMSPYLGRSLQFTAKDPASSFVERIIICVPALRT